jgi:hypothetical protein
VIEKESSHNHDVTDNLAGYSVGRRLNGTEKNHVRTLSQSGVSNSQILTFLKKNTENIFSTTREIANEKAKARAEYLKGRTPAHALYDELSKSDYVFELEVDDDGRIEKLFFIKRILIQLIRRFGTTFLFDCTYKTNTFGMPLLNIVGITCTYNTFNAGFALLPSETKENYKWALNAFSKLANPKVICTDRERALMGAIAEVFPECSNLLCLWHINKNILTRNKTKLGNKFDEFMADWNKVVFSLNRMEMEEEWSSISSKWNSSHPSCIEYLEQWMEEKERFILFLTNQFPHFGTVTTSRVEGNHNALKGYLKSPTSDLLSVFSNIDVFLMNQVTHLNANIEREKLMVPHHLSIPALAEVIGKISMHALNLFKVEFDHRTTSEPCTCSCGLTYGIPCRHLIRDVVERNGSFSVHDFHHQWWLFSPDEWMDEVEHEELSPRKEMVRNLERKLYSMPSNGHASFLQSINNLLYTRHIPIKNPSIVTKRKGRPKNRNKRANQRDKSAFEYQTGYKCKNCGQQGHNIRTCKNK